MQYRCEWARSDLLLQEYHDKEWGVPLHDDSKQFEFLCLEIMQAGLSWLTVLKKRDAFRKAFHDFDVPRVAAMGQDQVESLLQNEGIIRNQKKIEAIINNARAVLKIQQTQTLSSFFWDYVNGIPIDNGNGVDEDVPAKSDLSEQISKDLKKLKFSFVGPTIIYSHLQATGIVNDHVKKCFRHDELLPY